MSLSDALTNFRIVASPFVLAIFMLSSGMNLLWSLVVFCTLAEISDAFDGYFARKFNTVTDFGKLADPFADSIFRLTIFFGFAHQGWIPFWMPMILMYRDLIVSALRMYALQNNMVIAARASGKIKAIVQGTALFAIIFMIMKHGGDLSPVREPVLWLGYISVAITVYSCIDYIFGILKSVKEAK